MGIVGTLARYFAADLPDSLPYLAALGLEKKKVIR